MFHRFWTSKAKCDCAGAKLLSKNNYIVLFDDPSSIELTSTKDSCFLFGIALHNNKNDRIIWWLDGQSVLVFTLITISRVLYIVYVLQKTFDGWLEGAIDSRYDSYFVSEYAASSFTNISSVFSWTSQRSLLAVWLSVLCAANIIFWKIVAQGEVVEETFFPFRLWRQYELWSICWTQQCYALQTKTYCNKLWGIAWRVVGDTLTRSKIPGDNEAQNQEMVEFINCFPTLSIPPATVADLDDGVALFECPAEMYVL